MDTLDGLAGIEPWLRLGLALAIGILIGIERGWHTRDQHMGLRIAGIRSFALMGLLGGFLGLVSVEAGDMFLALAFLVFGALVIAAHVVRARGGGDFGITTEVAEMLTLVLGIVAVRGDMALAAAFAVVTTVLLAGKQALHRWIRHIERLELVAAIELLVISVVLLPLLPDRGFGPGGALNPFELWWMVVLISGLSFAGYLAIRLTGPRRGLILTGLLGGLAASTAVAVSFGRRGRRAPDLAPVLAAGIVAAASIMFLRILLVVAVIAGDMLPALAPSLATMAAVGLAGAALLYPWGGAEGQDGMATLSNPLELGVALKFAAWLVGVILVAGAVRDWLGDPGLFLVAGLSGLTDVDALTVSVSRMARDGLAAPVAVTSIVIAATVNTAVKGGIVAVLSRNPALWVRTGTALAAAVAAGLLVLWWTAG